ncbi:MAG TPA: M28 family peptidase [Vicinamibacterales bacterium]|nr:M28 family peptidase [Vicinamibacterales bacterium]
MKRVSAVLLIAAIGVGSLQADPRRIDPKTYIAHVKFLASEDLEGRGNGSRGLETAADYIAAKFREAGLEPAGDGGTFFQRFEMTTGMSVDPGNSVTLQSGRSSVKFDVGRDYEIVSTSGNPSASPKTLPVVFAGYGISAPAQRYDDYAGIDARDKAVLIFTHEPQEHDPRSAFEGQTNTAHSTMMRKVEVARQNGARAILIVDDTNHRPSPERFRRWLRQPQAEDFGMPVFFLSRDLVQRALGTRLNLDTTSDEIDRDFAPKSRVLPDLTVSALDRTTRVRRPVRNVIGILKGSDPSLQAEAVIVGAHYDHLGRSGRFAMSQNSNGQIHHGADDNASGTAAVIEMARVAVEARREFRRTIVFMTFAGEEHGLLGSSYYVNHPSLPLEKTIAMVNLDMVGRASGRIMVDGLANAPAIEADLTAAESASSLKLRALRGGPGAGASDDATFLLRRIPSINFFSGFHSDYHRPSDTWEKIDAAGGAGVADLALALVRQLANRAERPPFVETVQQEQDPHASGNVGAVSGYGPYFGSVPDFANEGQGVKFAEVRAGSPAAKAGLRGGDVMIAFAGLPIKTLYDFTFALREKKPGDRVDVVVLRDGKEVKASVELTTRP